MATPEGVDRLTDALAALLGDLAAPSFTWSAAHHRRLDALFGYRVDDISRHRPTRFSRALLGDFNSIGEQEMADVPNAERSGWALLRLDEAIDAEVAALAADRATLDHAALAADRLAAPALALFDADRPAELVRRYEQATARELSRTIQDFQRAEAPAAPIVAAAVEDQAPAPTDDEADPKSIPDHEIGPMASFGEPLPEAAVTPAARTTGRPAAPRTTPGRAMGPCTESRARG